MASTTKPDKKVPPPYAATKADPGAKSHSDHVTWLRSYMEYINSLAVRDLSTGSEAGFNN